MTQYATLKPLGSTDPRDLFDNAQNLDFAVNSISQAIWKDRFGVNRKTYWGMEQEFAAQLLTQKQRFDLFIQNAGYKVIGDYEDGPLTITEYNQLIRYNDEFWKLDAATDIPFTTTGNDATSWATDSTHFVSVGDAALRQELASETGAGMIGIEQGGTLQSFIDDMASLARYPLLQHKMIHDVDYNSAFAGAETLSQGFCIANTPAGYRMYFHQPVTSGNVRIVETTFDPGAANTAPTIISYSEELTDIGHQSIGCVYEGGSVVLYTLTKDGKGFNKITWGGTGTSNSNVTRTNVFQGSFYPADVGVTLAISEDAALLLIQTAGEDDHQRGIEDDKRVIYLFDRASGAHLRNVIIPKANMIADAFQGMACDGRYIYVLNGFTGVFLTQRVYIYNVFGGYVRDFNIDGVRGKYGRAQLMGNASLGYPVLQEPEGLVMLNGKLYMMTPDFWNTTASVVSYEGAFFAARAASFSGQRPVNSSYWTPTTYGTAGALPYSDSTTYTISNPSKRTKAIISIEVADGTGLPIDSGVAFPDSFASIFLNNNEVNIALSRGEALQICGFEQNLRSHRPIFMLSGESPNTDSNASVLSLYGRGFEDGSVTGRRATMKHRENATLDILEFRIGEDLLHGAGINLHSVYSATNPGRLQLYCAKPDGTLSYSLIFSPTTPSFHPQNDNEISMGVAANRFSDVRSYKVTCIVPGTTQPQIRAANDLKNMIFQVSTTGNGGIFDDTLGRWLTHTNTAGFSRFYYSTTVFDSSGNGSPEGVLTAAPGSEYRRLDGGIGTFKYQKQSGTGNTGWAAIA